MNSTNYSFLGPTRMASCSTFDYFALLEPCSAFGYFALLGSCLRHGMHTEVTDR